MEPIDLVALALLCDAVFDGDPTDRDLDPELFAIVEEADALALWRFGHVDHVSVSLEVIPPPACRALVLLTAGWSAPLDPDIADDSRPRPSLHPDRRRVFSTTVIGNDGEIVTAMRTAGEIEPQLLTGECYGRVPAALRRCWARRRPEAA